ncbi:DUF3429 domain-containing protein [Limnobacter sp.]|uniref:DUF3429 domain-containing protein n=1 Tax=Limnobacter sp. TaxID=2003368 RepID=UPI003511F4D4
MQGLNARWMRILGYAGLIPFLGLAALAWLNHGSDLATMFARFNFIYALCIVSFLGAVHWGIALGFSKSHEAIYLAGHSQAEFETRAFVWGVVPSLLAWLVGAFAPADYALALLALVLIGVWWMDRRILLPLKAFPEYLRLRNHLTLGAVLGLALTAMASQMV